jgi:hypothetical protein
MKHCRHSQQGVYDIFAHRIVLHNQDHLTLLHEYCHFIQNSTTIWGAERFNFFLSLIAHTSQVLHQLKVVNLPLLQHRPTTPEIQRLINDIESYWQLYEYWDRKEINQADFQNQPQLISRVVLVSEEDTDMPYYIHQEKNHILGLPIGGATLCESGAYALEQFYNLNRPNPTEGKIHASEHWYRYNILAYLLSRKVPDAEKCYLTTYLLTEFAFSVATPIVGFLLAYREAHDLSAAFSETQIFEYMYQVVEKHQDIINHNIGLELEMLAETSKQIESVTPVIGQVLEREAERLKNGLIHRQKNPFYFAEILLSRDFQMIGKLIKQLNPTMIEFTATGNVSFNETADINDYEILNALKQIVFSLLEDKDAFLDLPFEWYSDEEDKIRLRPQLDRAQQTNAYGLIASALGLTELNFNI